MKYIRIFVLLLAFCLLFAGCKKNDESKSNYPQITPDQIGSAPTEITFSHNGVSMTLPSSFSDYTDLPVAENYSFLYGASMVGIHGQEIGKDTVAEEITSLELYAADYASHMSGEAEQSEGIWTVQYEDLSENEPQMYVCALYETEDSYWIISAYCPSLVFEDYSQDMLESVTSAVYE